jgi:hypothetical protein
MKRVSALIAGFMLVAVLASCWLAFPRQSVVQCDGTVPTWMIQAQDYNGGGCAEVLPTNAAPPNADWTPYCLGLCTYGSPEPLPTA